MDERMAAWMKYANPGEEHDYLRKLAGTWRSDAQFWMEPGGEPTASAGESVNELILGGRFLKCDYLAKFMDSPFQGMSLDGFDKQKGKYVGIWVDTMSTMMLSYEGETDSAGNVRTMWGEYVDAMTGKPARMKAVTTVVSENEHAFETWNTGPDGAMYQSMKIVYTRK